MCPKIEWKWEYERRPYQRFVPITFEFSIASLFPLETGSRKSAICSSLYEKSRRLSRHFYALSCLRLEIVEVHTFVANWVSSGKKQE
jgi:hypothetical protein